MTYHDIFILVTNVISCRSVSAVVSSAVTIIVFFIGSVYTTNNPEYQTFFQMDVCTLCVHYYHTVDRQTEVHSLSYHRRQCVNNLRRIEPTTFRSKV